MLACGIARAADQPSPALAKVIEAAKKEPKLNLEWGGGILGGADALKDMAAAMNAVYGTNITIRFTPGPSLPEIVNQVVLANASGSPSPTDAVIGSDQHAADLAAKNASRCRSIGCRCCRGGSIHRSVEAEGRAIRIFTTMPGGIVYNTQLAPEKPTKLTDMLKPEWKGKIASTPYAGSWELLSGSDVWGQKAVDFARQLSPPARRPHPLLRSRARRLGRVHRLPDGLHRPRMGRVRAQGRADRSM